MDFLKILSWSIVRLVSWLTNKHRTDKIINSLLDMSSELFLITNLLEWSDSLSIFFKCACQRFVPSILWLTDNSTCESIALSCSIVITRLKNVEFKIRLLLPHFFYFIFVLVFFGLLTHLKEMRIKYLMWMQSVRIRVIFFVVTLVGPFKLDVASS